MTGKLYLLGLGLDPVEHATLETLQALSLCDVVFAPGLEPAAREFLGRFCKDLRPMEAGKACEREWAEGILEELRAGRTTGLATPAHPFLHGSLAGLLVNRCREQGIPWESYAAVSSLGVAIAATGKTLGEDVFGLQSVEASAVLRGSVSINPALPLVVYFLQAPGEQAKQLCQALGSIYGPDQPVVVCAASGVVRRARLSDLPGLAGEITEATVVLLESALRTKSPWGTLFEPRYRPPTVSAQDYKKAPAWVKE